MKSLSLFLATRYLAGGNYEKNISSMVLICFASILIGTFSLALTSAIMRGFEVRVHEKMQGIHAQAIIESAGESLNEQAIRNVITQEFPEVTHLSPASDSYALVTTAQNTDMKPVVVMLRGVDPAQERLVSTIEEKMVPSPTQSLAPSLTLADAIHDTHVIIGKKLAQTLGVTIGMPLKILYFGEPARKKKISVHQKAAYVGGIFDTGIDEFDSSFVMCSLPFFSTIFPDIGITTIHLRINPDCSEQKIIEELRDRTGLTIYSWKELYPALVSALKLEKYVMFFVLALITLVASMNIISLLFMLITQKRPDIAILRAMGMPYRTIMRIFLAIGMIIVLIASALGLTLAWMVSWILERYPFIELPDVYYVSHLPATMDWPITIAVTLAVLCISFFATWIPVRRIRTFIIADVLRFEG